ncbi:unnamed protein product [Dicrocoelium dendriticum]|nr:unnamed protein product [Dicrocoelium dendriticum]
MTGFFYWLCRQVEAVCQQVKWKLGGFYCLWLAHCCSQLVCMAYPYLRSNQHVVNDASALALDRAWRPFRVSTPIITHKYWLTRSKRTLLGTKPPIKITFHL